MQPLYLLALIGARLISIASLLILSHVMTAHAFGQFSLINTNALAIQMIAGSWLVSIANRTMVSAEGAIDRAMMAALLAAMLIITGIVLVAGLAYGAMHPAMSWTALATAALAIAFIIYEMALALKNAIGQEAAYASFAIYRNVLALALALGLVLAGSGPLGPVMGLLAATVFSLAFLPGTRRLWTIARPSWAELKLLRAHLGHGLAGGVALGIYILVNAPSRNLFAEQFGAGISGIWILCSDISYGPLAVLGNAYGLSQIRLIYIAATAGDASSLRLRARALLESTISIAVPYSIGACLFARQAVNLLLSQEQTQIAATIVVPATLQGAALLVLYAMTSVMLALRRFWLVGAMVVTVAVAALAGASLGSDIISGAFASMSGSAATVGIWLIWGQATGLFQIRLSELAKLAFASVAMWVTAIAVMFALEQLSVGGANWIVTAFISGIAFAATAILLNISGFIDMLPPTFQRYLPRQAN